MFSTGILLNVMGVEWLYTAVKDYRYLAIRSLIVQLISLLAVVLFVHKKDDIIIYIYGEGNQTRSFCYVDDLLEGMIRMMNSRRGFTGPVNMGNPKEFTIKELAESRRYGIIGRERLAIGRLLEK